MGMAGSGWAPRGRETRLHRADEVVCNVRLDRVPADPYPALGRVGARAWPKHEDRQRAGVLGIPQRRRGAEIGDAYLGRGAPKRPLPMCGTPRTRSSRTPCESIAMSNSTLVAPTSSASDGNAGLSRSLGTQGPDRRAWVAEVSVPERNLACQTQLAPIHFAIQPRSRLVSIRVELVVCSFHRVASGSALR